MSVAPAVSAVTSRAVTPPATSASAVSTTVSGSAPRRTATTPDSRIVANASVVLIRE